MLSQPIWIVTHAVVRSSRRTGSADGKGMVVGRLLEDLGDRAPVSACVDAGPAARWTLWVPITTST